MLEHERQAWESVEHLKASFPTIRAPSLHTPRMLCKLRYSPTVQHVEHESKETEYNRERQSRQDMAIGMLSYHCQPVSILPMVTAVAGRITVSSSKRELAKLAGNTLSMPLQTMIGYTNTTLHFVYKYFMAGSLAKLARNTPLGML